jgi:hypothetical protein
MAERPGPSAGGPAEEYRQLNRRLTEQVLERAETDPEWRQRYLDDPQAATAEFPEAQRLRQMEEEQRLKRNLNELVLDKAVRSPEWKQLLLDNPQAAIRELSLEMAEVQGQVSDKGSSLGLGDLTIWAYNYYDVFFPTQEW